MEKIYLDPELEAGDTISVEALDEQGPGGAPHAYRINWPGGSVVINFQRGPRHENNHNGILDAALAAILEDRIAHFQMGDYGCSENDRALKAINAYREALMDRARDRRNRNVLGTSQK